YLILIVYLPNCPEALIICLATASLGAIFSSAAADFGVLGVTERFSQIEPKVMFGCNAVVYNRKIHDSLVKLKDSVLALPSLKYVVVIPFVSDYSMDLSEIPNSLPIDEFLSMPADKNIPLEFEQVPFNHPLFIITVSWMMWNWLISSIALGTPIVLYDGSPIVPDYYRLWDLADEIGYSF
ncbi:unnamed protein product, partial [Adineta steineri]